MPKERNFNPVQAQRKSEKAKAIKKGKAELTSRRNEKLAKRNPERIRKQIEDLKAIETAGGKLSKHESDVLEALEKDLKAVIKARDALGDAAPTFGPAQGGSRGRDGGVLGKRRRVESSPDDSDVPDDVKRIPMPRDTPPPVPKDVLDAWWARRRARRAAAGPPPGSKENANETPLGDSKGEAGGRGRREGDQVEERRPVVESRTVYESKPVVRNLQKEAVTAFVPTSVRAKLDKAQGVGALMQPEEAEALEREGYLKGQTGSASAVDRRFATVEDAEEDP